MPEPRYLLWADLETTGTDEKVDHVIEIGYIITTPTLHPVLENSWVVTPPHWRAGTEARNRPEAWPDVVREMHEANGLINDIDTQVRRDAIHVQQLVIQDLMRFGKKHDFMLAGSGVSHFDRRFIQAQLPELEKWLQYPNLDVGVLRRAWQLFTPPNQHYPKLTQDKPHRALDDIRLHLQEADWWFGLLRGVALKAEP